nr:hypothetical protein [Tanacetum cinerariifolium]
LNIGEEERHVEEEDELYRDVNINQGRELQASLEVEDSHVTLTSVNPDGMESIFETTSQLDVPNPTSVTPLPITALTMTPSTIATITTASQAPILPTTVPSIILQNLPNFGSLFCFDDRLRSLEKTSLNSDEQRNLYKALVEAYESDKIIQDTYRVTYPEWFPQQQKPPSPDRAWNKTVPAIYGIIQPWISELAKQADTRSSFNELIDTPLDFSNFLINRLKYPHNLLKSLPLIPNNQGRRVIPFEHFINNDLEYLCGGDSSRKYTTSIMKTKAADYRHIKWIENLVPRIMWIKEPIGYDKHALWARRIIAVTELKIVEWHSYKHLDRITVRRDDDKLYKFKEGDFKRLRIQDIEDMLFLLVQGKLTNLTVEECFAFNDSLQMFTRSIVIQRRVKDLQLGVKSYQKKLNLTKPDSYRSNLKRKESYTAYSNPRGFIYQNKDKRNKLMRIDKLHKFSDGTLTDVRTALDDRLKGIRMQYLPKSIWRKSDKDRAATMIQAIDKRLKTRRIMRSLERFVGGRLYE